jgi:hypothetical protein
VIGSESAMHADEEMTWKIEGGGPRTEGRGLFYRLLCALIVPSFMEESSKNSKDFPLL